MTAVEQGHDQPLKAKRFRFVGYDAEVGPIGHLQHERARLTALAWERFDARLMGATIGAELHGISLADDLSDDAIAEIRQALLAYKVIFFRDQDLTAAQHVAFARRFGELEIHPFIPANREHPELVRFAKSADVGGYENGWHSDVSWRETPSLGAVLRAISVPPTGGDTLFADMAAVYDGLPDDLRAEADEAVAIHDFAQVFGHGLTPEALAEMHEQHPPVEHPVVRTHPETGRRLVYVNRFFVNGIKGYGVEEGRALVERLCRDASLPEYQCRFQWAPGSVAFWDNRAVQHYAVSDYWPDVRVMERASIVGDRPR
ncbi:MAG: taurine dioxygenase TauD-like protein [Acidimicrobiales bacterium]|nr:taurine dioxygenase TauD-like protein [Acidimicrobiales bacterium]